MTPVAESRTRTSTPPTGAAGENDPTCDARAAVARGHYLEGDNAGHLTVPGQTAAEWLDSGQCRDCFLPAFNHRPGNSAQYILAQGREPTDPGSGERQRFRLGFIASSDNHSARPGTGYKEKGRTEQSDVRLIAGARGPGRTPRAPEARSRPLRPEDFEGDFAQRIESERSIAEMMPWVMVSPRPKGLPIASTIWPRRTWVESPNFSGWNSAPLPSILSTAMSSRRSSPISLAGYMLPSCSVT